MNSHHAYQAYQALVLAVKALNGRQMDRRGSSRMTKGLVLPR